MAEKTKEKSILQGDFIYPDYEQAELGKIEQERITTLEKQLDYRRPGVVYALYCKLLQNKMLKTPEGFVFLHKLRHYLEDHAKEISGEIPGIPSELLVGVDRRELEAVLTKLDAEKEKSGKLNEKLMKGRIVIGFLVLAIIGMFIVTMLSDSPNILNYEKVLQNRYVEWQQELDSRERALDERERLLNEEG